MNLARVLTVTAAVLLTAGCRMQTEPEPTPVGLNGAELSVQLGNGLVQRIRLSADTVATNDILRIHSALTNRGVAPVALSSRICGLDLTGSLELGPAPGYGACGGYSMQTRLAPGDSITAGDIRQIKSPPGAYTLEITQLIQPRQKIDVRVVVR